MNLDSLRALVPGAVLLTDPGELRAHAADWSSSAILRDQRGALAEPGAILRPSSAEDVAAALAWATREKVPVIACGGRSGVSGGTLARGGELMIDMTSLHRVIELDDLSGVVRLQAGVLGTDLEQWLGEHGFTLGHFPQSIALSTVGGWIAARSAGQLSSGYGAIEDMLVGLTAALPDGTLATSRLAPRTAAGPQLHQLFLGSEGTLGVVIEAWLRVRHAPTARAFRALSFATFADGLEGARRMAQGRELPDAVRVYDEADIAVAFRSVADPPSSPVAVLVCEGLHGVDERMGRALGLAGGRDIGEDLARHWWEHRNDAVTGYRQVMSGETLGPEVAVDTMEVAALWSAVPALYADVRAALSRHAFLVGCHCSHVYETGCALYFTFLVTSSDREAALAGAWADALDAALSAGGTMTHHHGVGQLKAPWLARELGGFAPYLERVQRAFDGEQVMNPRTLRA